MNLRLALTAAKAFAIGVLVTFILVSLDRERVTDFQKREYLKWARQLTVEASSWVLHARNTVERDPYVFAAEMLSKTDVSRSFKIYPAQLSLGQGEVERMELDLGRGLFDYLRILEPETGRGFRVKIDTGYLGFLGTHSKVASLAMMSLVLFFVSLLIGVAFFLIELKVWKGVRWWFDHRSKLSKELERTREAQLHMGQRLKDVLTHGRTLLSEVDTQARLLNHSRKQIRNEVKNCTELYKGLRLLTVDIQRLEKKVLETLMSARPTGQEEAIVLTQITDEIDPLTRRLTQRIEEELARVRNTHRTLSDLSQTQSTVMQVSSDVTELSSVQALQTSVSEVVAALARQLQSVEAIENFTREK